MANNQSFRFTPPPVTTISSFKLPGTTTRILDNQIPLHIYSGCDTPVTYLSAIIRGGQAETTSPGIAVLASAMQREGSQRYNGEDTASILDYNGAWIKTNANAHHRQVSLYSLNSRLKDVLPIVVDLIFNPTFPNEALDVRREALARNIAISLEDVNFIAQCHSDKLIMGNYHPLSTIDYPDTIRNISSDVLLNFHNKFTTTNNIELFLCGQITPDIENIIAETFNNISEFGEQQHLNIARFAPAQSGSTATIDRPGASQSAVMITLPAISRSHPDYHRLHLTIHALGGYFGSRLMLNIREEKGLTYGISAQLMGYIDDAHIQISAETDNANVYRLIDEVKHELNRLSSDPCCGDELTRLRQQICSMQSAILDSPFSIIEHHITSLIAGLPSEYFDARQCAIAALTPDIIAETAKKYLDPEQIRITIVGDTSKM